MMTGKIIGPFTQLLTWQEAPARGPLTADQLHILTNAGIAVDPSGRIIHIDRFADLSRIYPHLPVELIEGQQTAIPGFIDSHTHICWAAGRAADYAMRLEGKTYLEIAEAGGGIWSSVVKTRETPEEELTKGILSRAAQHLRDGVTTIEVKSGYGLDTESEVRILQAIRSAGNSSKAELIPTCLAAHMKARDFNGTERDYLHYLLDELLPRVKKEKLSSRIDIFIETTAFTPADGEWYLKKASESGFQLTVHADQFTTGGSLAGIHAGALSVDHLEASGDREIRAIADSACTATLLPGASMGLGMEYPPARKLMDAGARVSIASDWNPGSAPMGDLLMQAAVMGAAEKLTLAETLAAITYRAATALGLSDRGRLIPGELADIQSYDTSDYRDIFYYQGKMKPVKVWKNGL